MSWNVQGGGGPWGPRGGGDGPWGGSPGGGQPGPDIEELLRRGQDRIRGLLPGNLGGRGIFLLVIAVVAVWGFSGLYTVEPEEQGVELRFGEHVQTTQPGLNYHLPYPIEKVIVVPVLTVRREEIGFRSGPEGGRGGTRNLPIESLMLTGDENIIETNFVVQWAVKDAADFAFNVRNQRQTVRFAAESAMREVIGESKLAAALAEGRAKVSIQTEELLQSILDEYRTGIIVTDLLLQRSDPPDAVIDDYRDVQRARADQERLINEAQAYQNRVIPEANGQAAQIRQEAQGYKQEVVARAEGQARRFLSVYEQYRLAREVTKKRIYLETMESVFRDMNKVIIDSGAQGAGGVVPYLPLPEIQKRAVGGRSQGSQQ